MYIVMVPQTNLVKYKIAYRVILTKMWTNWNTGF